MFDYYEEPEYYNPEDFLEDYEVELRETVVNAVNKKIKNSLEELERLRTKYKESLDEIHKLKYNLGDINRHHEKDLKEEHQKGYKEAERNLGLGFAVFDTVYRVKTDYEYSKCPKCNGNYKIKTEVLGKEIEVNCPHCSSGRVFKKSYRPEKDEIRSIKFYITGVDRDRPSMGSCIEEKNINIYLKHHDYEVKRDEIYHSLEECQKVCDEKNLKENNK